MISRSAGVTDLVPLDFVEIEPFPGQQRAREGLKQVIDEMVVEERQGISRFTWHGTHHGEFFCVPATGRQITVKGRDIDRVVTGRMVASRILMDTLGMMTQLGVIPAEKAAT